MKVPPQVQAYMDRIDALSLRERTLVFLAASLVIVSLVSAMVLDPVLGRQKQMSQRLQQQQDEIRAMELQLQSLAQARTSDSAAANRTRLSALRAELGELERRLENKQQELIPPEKMPGFLGDILKRHRDVQLVSLQTLVPTGFSSPSAASRTGPAREMYRHGVEVVLAGQYFDLLGYVEELERLPLKVFWGGLDIDASGYPRVTLKLAIYTLSPEKTWLTV